MATKKGAKKSAKRTPAKKSAARKSTKKASKVAGKSGAAEIAQGRCRNWQAVSDRMPPGPATLTVTGECTFPTPSYKVRLVKAEPQGINPAILLLRKVVTPPTGPRPAVLQTIPVGYRQRGGTQYTDVTILPDGVTIRVKIVV